MGRVEGEIPGSMELYQEKLKLGKKRMFGKSASENV